LTTIGYGNPEKLETKRLSVVRYITSVVALKFQNMAGVPMFVVGVVAVTFHWWGRSPG
jgi:hypothetical protein